MQGTTSLPAGQSLDVAPTIAAGWGDAWTQLVRPFRALPLLAIVGPGAHDIMGCCLLAQVFSGLVITGCLYFLQLA